MNKLTFRTHNKEAHKLVTTHFAEGNRQAGIIQPQGTGKSRVIASVASGFDRILVMAPDEPAIRHISRSVQAEATYLTYADAVSTLSLQDYSSGLYDLIVLDGFRQTTSDQWEGIDRILAANPQAKVLGTSDSDVRRPGFPIHSGERFFKGHIMYSLSLGQAWAQGILPAPVYVCGLAGFDKTRSDYMRRIDSAGLSESAWGQSLSILNKVAQACGQDSNVPGLLRTYVSPAIRRVLVFCPESSAPEQWAGTVKQWFLAAGLTVQGTYVLPSEADPLYDNVLEAFGAAGTRGITLLATNLRPGQADGIPQANAVILLGQDTGGSGYLPLLGRYLSGRNTGGQPVVFDLRDHLGHILPTSPFSNIVADYRTEKEILERQGIPAKPGIRIEDCLKRTRELIAGIRNFIPANGSDDSWDSRYEEARRHFEQTGHFPPRSENNRISQWADRWVSKRAGQEPERLAMLKAIGYVTPGKHNIWDRNYREAKTFFEKTGRFPDQRSNRKLYQWAIVWTRRSGKDYPERLQMLHDIGFRKRAYREDWDTNYTEAKAHFEQTGHFPTSAENKRIHAWADQWVKDPSRSDTKRMALLHAIGYKEPGPYNLWDTNYRIAKEHFERTGHFPTVTENKAIYDWAYKWARTDSELKSSRMALLEAIGYKDPTRKNIWVTNYAEAKAHFEQTGHFPRACENGRLYSWANNWIRANGEKDKERMQKLYDIGYEEPSAWRVWDKNYRDAQAHFKRTGHFPTMTEDKRLYQWAKGWVANSSARYPERLEMLRLIGYEDSKPYKQWDTYYRKAKEHFEQTGHFPMVSEDRALYLYFRKWAGQHARTFPERMVMLADIGYVMPASFKEWDSNYAKAKEHFEKAGHFPTLSENPTLNRWAHTWALKDSWMYPERLQMLQGIGFRPRRTTLDDWNKNYLEARAFFKENGHFPSSTENTDLCAWAKKWITRSGKAEPERLQMLYEIGYRPDINWTAWDRNYSEAKRHFEQTGRFPSLTGGRRILDWAKRWVKAYGTQYPERMQMLYDIGYGVNPQPKPEEIWERNYRKAKEHFEQTGHFPLYNEKHRLRAWASEWVRTKAEQNPEKMQLLLAIGYPTGKPVSTRQNAWETKYRRAEAFYRAKGHFPSSKENASIRLWADEWVRKSSLRNPGLLQRLKAIGYTGTARVGSWDARYNDAKRFFDQHGHFPDYTEDRKLRSWANNWVAQHSGEDPGRFQMLQAIGYAESKWKRWDRNYQAAKEHYVKTGHFPTHLENRKVYAWARQWEKNASHTYPERLEMLKAIGYGSHPTEKGRKRSGRKPKQSPKDKSNP